MAIERQRRVVRACAPDTTLVNLAITYTSSGTTYAVTAGDKSLVTSITNNGTGSFTINFKQVGYRLCGASVTPIVASPGTAAVQSGVIKAFSSSGKTCNVQLLKGDGSAVVPADADLILVTLIFRDSVGV